MKPTLGLCLDTFSPVNCQNKFLTDKCDENTRGKINMPFNSTFIVLVFGGEQMVQIWCGNFFWWTNINDLPTPFMKYWLKWQPAGKLRFRQTFWKLPRQPSTVISYSRHSAADSKSSFYKHCNVSFCWLRLQAACVRVVGRLTWRCGCWGWCPGRPPGRRPSARSATWAACCWDTPSVRTALTKKSENFYSGNRKIENWRKTKYICSCVLGLKTFDWTDQYNVNGCSVVARATRLVVNDAKQYQVCCLSRTADWRVSDMTMDLYCEALIQHDTSLMHRE